MKRYRCVDNLQRVDTIDQKESQWGKDEPYALTYINGKRNSNGMIESIQYDNALKSCSLMADQPKGYFVYEDIWTMKTIASELWFLLRGATGRRSHITKQKHGVDIGMVERDDQKVEALLNEKNPVLRISLSPETLHGREVNHFIVVPAGNSEVEFSVFSDKEDVSRIVQFDVKRGHNGALLKRIEADKFDANGFPQYWKSTTYKEGIASEYDERHVVHVSFNETIPDDVFAFQIPNGYVGAKQFPDKLVIINSDGTTRSTPLQGSVRQFSVTSAGRYFMLFNFMILIGVAGFIVRHRLRKRGR